MFEFDLVKKEEKDFINLLKPKYLTRDFLDNYKNKKVPFGQLGLIVYLRTYSRYIPELKRREYWWETCLRVVEYSLSLVPERSRTYFSFEDKQKEAEELFDNVFNLNVFPSGRTLFVGGTEAVRLNPSANFNCSFTVVDSIKSFVDAMYLLMLGCGVGYSVEKQYIDKLPEFYSVTTKVIHEDYLAVPKKDRLENTVIKIEHNEISKASGRTIYITIGDSKNGWVDALNYYLESFTELHTTIVINYNNVRPEGERLKTFGGRASGHRPLKLMFEEIEDRIKGILNNTIDSVTAMDIMNSIAKAIVVGGVRRSSQIVFGDVDDIKYIEAKKDLWSDPNKAKYQSTRVLSNNSIHLWQKPSWDKLVSIFDTIKNNGEPGLYIAENAAKRRPNYGGSNPCLRGDMKLLTNEGYKTFEELKDTEPFIVNKDGNIVKSKVWCSGNKEIFKLNLSSIKSIYCTKDHKFLVDNKEVEAINLYGKRLTPFLKAPNHNLKLNLFGFILGDGTLTKDSSKLGETINIGAKDEEIVELLDVLDYKYSVSSTSYYVSDLVNEIDNFGFNRVVSCNRTLPTEYFNLNKNDKAAFLSGMYSANGSFIKSVGRIAYKTTSLSLANELVETLEKDFGIYSYITTNQSKLVEFSNGTYKCKESYDINISRYESKLEFFNNINFIHKYKKEALVNWLYLHSPKVTSVTSIGFDNVYDFTELETHWGVVEGFITHNCGEILLDSNGVCNLTTTNLVNFVLADGNWDKDKLFRVTKLSVRMGSRITLVDMWDKEWDYIQKRDRLLGVSLTGIVDAYNLLNDEAKKEFPSLIKQLRDIARQECDKYHDELGIPRSLLVTTNKPEGSISQLPTVSSGIHAPYSPYYFRRVRVSKTDPVSKALLDLGLKAVPENNQGDDINSNACNTLVFTIPIKTSATIRAIDESAIEQLERYKLFITNYVEHTVSVTITVAEHEWDDVTQWVWNNWEYCIGIAFLPRFDPSELESPYPNMPYESITKEQYYDIELDEEKFIELISKYELEHEEHELEYDCKTGCPVR